MEESQRVNQLPCHFEQRQSYCCCTTDANNWPPQAQNSTTLPLPDIEEEEEKEEEEVHEDPWKISNEATVVESEIGASSSNESSLRG